jgi:hypothetical protein
VLLSTELLIRNLYRPASGLRSLKVHDRAAFPSLRNEAPSSAFADFLSPLIRESIHGHPFSISDE